jgi:predicted nucleotidyltransferase
MLLLKRNGCVLEQLLSPMVVAATPSFEELRTLAPGCITRFHAHHYLGFAATQRSLWEKESPRRLKPLLYVYRVLLTGIHLMRTGEVEANLGVLLGDRPDLAGIDELILRKRAGSEGLTIADTEADAHAARHDRLVAELGEARDASALPERPSTRRAIDDLIIRARLDGLRATGSTGAAR